MSLPPDQDAFKVAVEFVLKHEGGLVDHAQDPGGITNHGISLRFAMDATDLDKDGRLDLDIDGNGQVNADDIRKLTADQAKDVYRMYFWHPLRCDEYAAGLGLLVFDTAVNQGRGAAIGILQAALRVPVDGRLGPVTIGAAKRACAQNAIGILDEYTARRVLRYAGTKNLDAFGLGWMRRAIDIHTQALMMERF